MGFHYTIFIQHNTTQLQYVNHRWNHIYYIMIYIYIYVKFVSLSHNVTIEAVLSLPRTPNLKISVTATAIIRKNERRDEMNHVSMIPERKYRVTGINLLLFKEYCNDR